MKKLVLVAAVSAALFAGQTFAVPASVKAVPLVGGAVNFSTTSPGIYANDSVVHETWISGSSAATPFLEKAIVNDSIGTVYKYQDSGKKAFTYVSESALVPGEFNVVHKRDSGGSITGIKSAQGILTGFNETNETTGLGIITATCGAVAASGIATCNAGSTIPLTNHAANANFSDVDAAQFESALNGGVVNASTVVNESVATQTFGFAVNLKLRNAMQKVMIADAALPITCTVGDESEGCMPSLTSAALSSIFAAGRVTDWGNVRFGGLSGQNLVSAQVAVDRPANRDIHICSRTAGSGTLATTNIKFENAPCFGGNEAIQAASVQTVTAETGTSGSMKAYHSNSGSSDVESCLQGLDTGSALGNFTPYPGIVGTTVAPAPNFRWAIGILGTERNANNALPYRFIKIDGVSPSAANVAQGKYKFWAELVLVGATSTDTLTTDLIANVKNATQISTVNVNNANFGITGYLGVANNSAFAPTYNTAINGFISAAFDPNRPVNPFTHEVNGTGGSLNHCRVPTVSAGAKALPALY